MFDVANGVACLNGEDAPRGTPSHEAIQFHLKEHWRCPQLLNGLLPWSETISANLDWWKNLVHVMKAAEHSPQRPQYPNLHRRLKQRLGYSLRASLYKGSVVRQGKKATYKCSRVTGGTSGPEKVQ